MKTLYLGETGAAVTRRLLYHANSSFRITFSNPDHHRLVRRFPTGNGEFVPLQPVFSFDSHPLCLKRIVVGGASPTFVVQSTASTASCPLCGEVSARPHSRYVRRLADLPCHDQPVRFHLEVRRFFCGNANCRRRIFAERLPAVAAAHARTTVRLDKAHCNIGLALGGEAGARLAARLAMPTSADTLLRRVRRAPLPEHPVPRVLGIDDWARRKGCFYGTILCDLERGRVVDLLPDRSADSVAAWLRAHPGVEIISRDRSGAYAAGSAQGAPEALQVADRWHLLKNVRETIERLLDRKRQRLHQAAQVVLPAVAGAARPDSVSSPPAPVEPRHSSRQAEAIQTRRSRRQERYEHVRQLHLQGLGIREIARRLRLGRGTVRRFVHAEVFPERAIRRAVSRQLDAFTPYLRRRWEEGCHNQS
jgi:transposase